MGKSRLSRRRRLMYMSVWGLCILFLAPALIAVVVHALGERPHWRDASHASTGQAPSPQQLREAIVQVYAARTWGRRGGVAVHTWIAAKRTNASQYKRYEIIGWRLRSGSALVVGEGTPDALWFSNTPQLLVDLRGAGVETVIDQVEAAVRSYPHSREYRTWPGPNSNTFVAHIGRQVPALGLDLPPTAIGKDYLAGGALFGPTPSGTGYQLSLLGAGGILVARNEGVELNLLGSVVGIRAWPPAVKLPGFGTWPARANKGRLEHNDDG